MKLKVSGVYQITNEINGHFYIGSSSSIRKRWRQWKWYFKTASEDKTHDSYRSPLTRAVLKYGIEHFTFIVVEECEATKEMLQEREQHYIDRLKPTYNILPNAYTNLGHKHTDEWKQAMSERAKAYMAQPEVKQKYSELRKGKTFDEIFGENREEVRLRQSEGRTGKHVGFDPWNKGIPITDEQKALLNAGGDRFRAEHGSWNKGTTGLMPEPWNKNIPMPDEIKQKVSQAKKEWFQNGGEAWNKGVPASETERQRLIEMSKANWTPDHQVKMTEAARLVTIGVPRSEETRQRISEGNLQSEARKDYAESIRGISRTDEVKEKLSEALRASDKAAAYHASRIGKTRGNSSSGEYGIIWDKARNKHQVRIRGKAYGRFETLEEAVAKRDEILNTFHEDQSSI